MATKDTETKAKKRDSYGADAIQVLEGLEPVRKRPGMYIGTTGPDGLHHLIWEIFDNARDEAMGGFANDIEVALMPGEKAGSRILCVTSAPAIGLASSSAIGRRYLFGTIRLDANYFVRR